MVDALISTEDERFYEHSGIDWRGTLRAFVYLVEQDQLALKSVSNYIDIIQEF